MLDFIKDCVFVPSRVKTRFLVNVSHGVVNAVFNLCFLHYIFAVCFQGCFSVRFVTYINYVVRSFYLRFVVLGFVLPIKFASVGTYGYRLYLIYKRFLKLGIFCVDGYYCTCVCICCRLLSVFECLYLLKKMRCGLYIARKFAIFFSNRALYGGCNFGKYRVGFVSAVGLVYDSYFCNVLCDRIEKHTCVFFYGSIIDNYLYYWVNWLYNCIYSKYLFISSFAFDSLYYFANFRSVSHLLGLRFLSRWNDVRVFTIQGCLARALTVTVIKKLACYWALLFASFFSLSFLRRDLFAFLLTESYYCIYLLIHFLKLVVFNLYVCNCFYIDNCVLRVRVVYTIFYGVGLWCFFLRLLINGVVITYCVFAVCCYISCVSVIPVIYVCCARLVLYSINTVVISWCVFYFPFRVCFNSVKVRVVGLGFFYLYRIFDRYIIREILLLRSIL
ncbi:hypothetical protein JSR02_00220 [Candidatus Vidania fulgoroideae]|uniref:Uncharacterized protein n=1 Tax=Candidatus Vidania fulgoroideorum TaxID=881286 RepID=A0A975ADS7_9PROT|nr:hypothetical protein JSR02_00220 [Candidatus Vidania fulgoroideae]